jgi:predicted  nucleic acid-binding Zn-ribbon protein
LEADLKKRVDAFQKEVERRKKQKEKLRNREEALDKREEELSHRFLELKSRENEITVRENNLQKTQKDLETKEEELKTWESEIDTNRKDEVKVSSESAQPSGTNKEEWLAAQRKFQADLFGLKDDMSIGEQGQITGNRNEGSVDADMIIQDEKLKEVLNQLDELKNQILEKDKEIESLKEDGTEFNVDEETRKILKILDDLLENLPDEVVDEFAKSNDYLLYEKVLEKYKL